MQKMKKICIICVSGFPIPAINGGAIETLVQEIIDQNEVNPRYYFTVLSTDYKNVNKFDKQYQYTEFIRFKKYVWIDRFRVRLNRLINFLGKKRQFVPSDKLSAIDYLKKFSDKFDLFLNETGMEEYIYADNYIPYKKRVYHLHGVSLYNAENEKYTNNIISISEFCKMDWLKIANTSEKNIFILKNCINIKKFNKEFQNKDEFKKKLGIPKENFVIYFSGRIIQEKGVRELIQAVSLLNDSKITLLIIGGIYYKSNYRKTDYYKELEELAQKSKSQIIFAGYVENKELYKYYSVSDIVIVPSIWQEPAGLVVIEAASAGKPIIATKTGGIPEMITKDGTILIDNDSKIVKSLKEKIDYLRENDLIRKEMSKNNKEFSLNFSEENYFINFCQIIDNIINQVEL